MWLQNFVLVKDTLGVTRVGDLAKADVTKLRSLALIELTALFDIHNITYTRRKPKRRHKGTYAFATQDGKIGITKALLITAKESLTA